MDAGADVGAGVDANPLCNAAWLGGVRAGLQDRHRRRIGLDAHLFGMRPPGPGIENIFGVVGDQRSLYYSKWISNCDNNADYNHKDG